MTKIHFFGSRILTISHFLIILRAVTAVQNKLL